MKQKEKESDCIFWKLFLIWIQNSSFPKTKSTTFSYFSFSLLTRADVWVHWPGLLFHVCLIYALQTGGRWHTLTLTVWVHWPGLMFSRVNTRRWSCSACFKESIFARQRPRRERWRRIFSSASILQANLPKPNRVSEFYFGEGKKGTPEHYGPE